MEKCAVTTSAPLTVLPTIQLNPPNLRLRHRRSLLILFRSRMAQLASFALGILSHAPYLVATRRDIVTRTVLLGVLWRWRWRRLAKDGVERSGSREERWHACGGILWLTWLTSGSLVFGRSGADRCEEAGGGDWDGAWRWVTSIGK